MPTLQPQQPQTNYTPITQGNMGSGSIPDLWKHLGRGQSSYRGNNPALDMYQSFVPLLGSRINSQLLFGNELEGQKQGSIQNLIRMLSPQSIQANADRMRTTGVNAAMSQGPQQDFAMRQMLGNSATGARAGAMQSGINQANQGANDYLANMNSPEGQMGILQAILAAIGAGQGSDLDMFRGLQGDAETGAQNRAQNAKGGGLAGALGGIGGMFLQANPQLFMLPGKKK
jgi:hypothetical protein